MYNVHRYRDRIRRADYRSDRRGSNKAEPFHPSVALIIAVKGADDRFESHLRAIASQDYPEYRIIYTVQDEHDPAHAAIARFIESRADTFTPSISIITAGPAQDQGQKVHNLLAALEHLTDIDTAIAFADADTVPPNDWLATLIRPLSNEGISVTSGYRWLIPTASDQAVVPSLPSRLVSVLNASVATAQGPGWRSHAWGGSMALLQTTMHEINLADHWRGSISDDYQMTRAVRLAGRSLSTVPVLLIPSPVEHTWGSLFAFARRQYQITRVYSPFIWLLALFIFTLYTAGWIAALVAAALQLTGWAWGLIIWGAVILADLARASQRSKLAAKLFGPEAHPQLAPVFTLERFATPVVMALHAVLVLAGATSNTIRWAGYHYKMRGRQSTNITQRPSTTGNP